MKLEKESVLKPVVNNGLLQWRGSGISEMAQVVVLKFLAIFVMAWCWLVATESKPPDVVRNLVKTDKKIMKLSKILIFTIFFIKFSFLYSQENNEITQNWNQLNQKLIYRTEITLELVNEIKNSKKVNKTTLHKTISSAKELKTLCENKNLNKTEVRNINKKNNELSTYLVRVMVNIEQDAKLKSKEELLFLFDQLYAIENQIYAEIKKYNESCVKYEKEELIFEINEEKKAPKVEFK